MRRVPCTLAALTAAVVVALWGAAPRVLTAETPGIEGVAFYLPANPELTIEQARAMKLADIVLQDEPMIRGEDIYWYDARNHTMLLRGDTLPSRAPDLRLWKFSSNPVPMVVCLGKERRYLAGLDTNGLDKGATIGPDWDKRMAALRDTTSELAIQYPWDYAEGKDPRDDEAILGALRQGLRLAPARLVRVKMRRTQAEAAARRLATQENPSFDRAAHQVVMGLAHWPVASVHYCKEVTVNIPGLRAASGPQTFHRAWVIRFAPPASAPLDERWRQPAAVVNDATGDSLLADKVLYMVCLPAPTSDMLPAEPPRLVDARNLRSNSALATSGVRFVESLEALVPQYNRNQWHTFRRVWMLEARQADGSVATMLATGDLVSGTALFNMSAHKLRRVIEPDTSVQVVRVPAD